MADLPPVRPSLIPLTIKYDGHQIPSPGIGQSYDLSPAPAYADAFFLLLKSFSRNSTCVSISKERSILYARELLARGRAYRPDLLA
jgi:hypothetical protein